MLVDNLEAYKHCTRLGGAIEVARVTELATIEVGLEMVQDILHTSIDL